MNPPLFFTEQDVTDEDEIIGQAADHHVMLVRVKEHGPGGGWALYRFLGTSPALVSFLTDVYDLNVADTAEMMEPVTSWASVVEG